MQIAIIGAGNVGGALGKVWARAGHAIVYGVPDPSHAKHRAPAEAAGGAGLFSVTRAVQGADTIVLAVPFDAVGDVLTAAGDLAGRLLIDVTNPLRMGATGLELSLGFDRSAAEHVASLAPGAAVFKTLNQVGYEVMENTAGYAAPPVMFVAGDDATRKPVVMGLVTDLGFRAVDAGGLRRAAVGALRHAVDSHGPRPQGPPRQRLCLPYSGRGPASMRTRFGLEIAITSPRFRRPERMALAVYDMQARICDQPKTRKFKNWSAPKLRRQRLFTCPRVIDHQRQHRVLPWS
jgi:8-hydroxy-5-deazaflavin:NADPH oxidoreductase